MLKLKSFVPAAVAVGFVFSAAYAQEAKEVVHERPIETRTFQSASRTPVRAFAIQGGNTLWYATDETLVSQPMAARTHQAFPRMGDISTAGIKSIIVDPAGRVWFAGPEGVAVRIGNNFTFYTTANGLPSNKATSLAAGRGGEVWVGTEEGAARFRDGTWTVFNTDNGLPGNRVNALAADSKGQIWFGTNRGAAVYDGTKFTVYNMRDGAANQRLTWNNVRVLGIEPHNDVVWAVVGDEGDINSFTGTEWRHFLGIQRGVTSIMGDTRRIWFGHEGGVLRFNGDEWVAAADRHGVNVQQVFAMHRDSEGNLWYAMETGILRMSNPYRR